MKKKHSSNTPKMAWWKITALAVGIVLVLAATTYSLVTRHSSASSGTLSQGIVPPVAADTGNASNGVLSQGVVPSVAANTIGTPVRTSIGDLKWVKNVNTKFTNNDFIFVIMPGSDNTTEVLSNRVADAATRIESAKGTPVETITLSASDPEFSITKERLAISQLPAILAASKSNALILTGDITLSKLLQAYLVVSQPICAPGSSPGCCK